MRPPRGGPCCTTSSCRRATLSGRSGRSSTEPRRDDRSPCSGTGGGRRAPTCSLRSSPPLPQQERRDDNRYRLADFVSSSEIATMFGVTGDAVRQWCRRRVRTGFPEPLMRHPQVWDRREVLDWARRPAGPCRTGGQGPARRKAQGGQGCPVAADARRGLHGRSLGGWRRRMSW
jgi:hypothetical protein